MELSDDPASAGSAEQRAALPRPGLLAALAVLLVLVAYVPVVGGPFIWDDHQLLFASNRVSEVGTFKDYFGSAFWLREDVEPGGRSYYRPLVIASFAVDYLVHGSNAGGFHVTNLLLHGLNTALVFALLSKRRVGVWARTAGALLWGLFPRLTEAAAWISGRTDVLAGTFVLLALLCAASTLRPRYWLAAPAALLGMLSKEVALAALVAVAGMAWLETRGAGFARRARALAPVGLAAAAYASLRIWAIGAPIRVTTFTANERVLAALEALGRYAYMTVNGWTPNAQIGMLGVRVLPFVFAGLVVATFTAVYAVRRRAALRDPLVLGAALALFVSVGLVLHVVPITVTVVSADRFLYVPLAALVLLGAPAVERLALAARPRLAAASAAVLIASFGVTTARRSAEWADEIGFWEDVLRNQHAQNSTAGVELGNLYLRAGLPRKGLALYLDARRGSGDSNELMAIHNAGCALLLLGRYEEAAAVLEQLVRVAPFVPKFHMTLASVYLGAFEFEKAKRAIDAALQAYPDYPGARPLRASIPRLEKATALLKQRPRTDGERFAHARLFADLERHPDALRLLAEVVGKPSMKPKEATLTVLYALKFGSARAVRELGKRYALYGNARAPLVVDALAEREERVARLTALWPTLGVKELPEAPDARATR